MKTKYRVEFPVTKNMGSYSTVAKASPMETVEENALWDYNSARAHDGLPPLKVLPKGTKMTRIYDWLTFSLIEIYYSMKQTKEQKCIDSLIANTYYKFGNRMQISILDIPKIYRDCGPAALVGQEELDKAMQAAIAKYRAPVC